ncbi:MAG: FHA domain-containing protein [Phycisphaerales bacterium]|nr:FHA domain-containing protein [Phycisphaerales bacterium]
MSDESATQLNPRYPPRHPGNEPPLAAPHLVVLEGPDTGKQIALRSGTTSIGRAEDSDLVLDTPHASRHHARVILRDEQYEIEDLNSRNGVIINGRKLDPQTASTLSHGDAIRIADQVIVFLDASAQEDSRRLSTISVDRNRVRSEVDEMLKRTGRPFDKSHD